jgi:hypothetical protein
MPAETEKLPAENHFLPAENEFLPFATAQCNCSFSFIHYRLPIIRSHFSAAGAALKQRRPDI